MSGVRVRLKPLFLGYVERHQLLLWVTLRHFQPCPECPELEVEQTSISGGWMSVCSHHRTFDMAGFPSANQPDSGADRDLPCQFRAELVLGRMVAQRVGKLRCFVFPTRSGKLPAAEAFTGPEGRAMTPLAFLAKSFHCSPGPSAPRGRTRAPVIRMHDAGL